MPSRPPGPAPSPDALERWLVQRIAQIVEAPDEIVDGTLTFAELGLSSIDAVDLAAEAGRNFELAVDPLAIWDYPTPTELAAHLAGPPELPARPPRTP